MQSRSAPMLLQYAVPAPRSTQRVRLVFLLLTLPGAVVPFVSFTYSVSPLHAVSELPSSDGFIDHAAIFMCGCSFFLVFGLIGWKLRLLLGSRPSKWEVFGARAAAFIGTVPVATLFLLGLQELIRSGADADGQLIAALSAIFALIMAGSWIAHRQRRRELMGSIDAMLIGPYLANAAFCLLAFWRDPELGYWLTVPVAIALAAELVLLFAQTTRIGKPSVATSAKST